MINLARQVTCIRKCRDNNNKIRYYLLRDDKLFGSVDIIISDELKLLMKERRIKVSNLRLSIKGSIIDSNGGCPGEDDIAFLPSWLIKDLNCPKHLTFNSKLSKQQLQQLIMKAELMNCDIKQWDNLVIIESVDRIMINSIGDILLLDDLYDKYDDIITSERGAFKDTEFKSINLKGLNTSYMRSFNNMFRRCKTDAINLCNTKTGNVTEASGMFADCTAKSIQFGLTNFINLLDTSYMFAGCKLKTLDLSQWIAGNIFVANCMFLSAQIDKLNVQSLINNKVQNLENMFAGFKTPGILDLNSFCIDSDSTWLAKSMFNRCEAKEIWLQNFYIKPYVNHKYMFERCKADVYGPEVLSTLGANYKGRIPKC